MRSVKSVRSKPACESALMSLYLICILPPKYFCPDLTPDARERTYSVGIFLLRPRSGEKTGTLRVSRLIGSDRSQQVAPFRLQLFPILRVEDVRLRKLRSDERR